MADSEHSQSGRGNAMTQQPGSATRTTESCSEAELLQEIARKQREAAKAVERKEPKQVPLPTPQQRRDWTPEEIAQIEAEQEERRQQDTNRRRWAAWDLFIYERGKRYGNCRLGNFDTTAEDTDAGQRKVKAIESLRGYAKAVKENVEAGRGIVLFGPKGSGKDHLMCAMVAAAIGSDLSVSWQNGMDLFGDLRDLIGRHETEQAFINKLVAPSVLYISDPLPPVGKVTDYQAAMLFRILDARYSDMKPTWVTVNVSSGIELDERLGPQNGDRLRDGALCIHCDWASYRKRAN